MVGGNERGYLLPLARKPVFSHLSRETSGWTLLPAVEIPAVSLVQKEDQTFQELLELTAGARAG